MITMRFAGVDDRFLPGLRAFGERYGFAVGDGGLTVSVKETGEPRLSVARKGAAVEIGVGKPRQELVSPKTRTASGFNSTIKS